VTSPTQQPVDNELRQYLVAGQYREVFERVVELYSEKVFHLAFSMVRNETQAEDMTQEILLRIWKGLPGYHGGASLSTWVYTIARNTCLTELKKRASHPTVSLQTPEFEAAMESRPTLQSRDPEAGIEMDVNLMLSQLPDRYRQVITLFYLEEKSYEELSGLLGLPLGTVKTLLFRAKKELVKISNRRAPPAKLSTSFSA
jgi:RNA polymerase sigma-70 factor (ECF subfamily)